MFKKLISYFLQGLLYTVPVALTLYVIFNLFVFIDGILPFDIPGLGIIVLLLVITFLGFLGTTIIAQPVMHYSKRLLDRAPLIKTIYSAIKDLLSAFVGQKKTFDQPVLVKMNKEAEISKLGFVTKSDLSELGIGKEMVAVYLPHSYNFSGNLFVVPAKNITPIKARSADIMKFIVSGGVTGMEVEE